MTKAEFESQYMTQLNPQQREAVFAVDGATLLLAVPGSGKTTVLVTRLGYMVHCCGIPPEKILTMTYTIDATNEMRQRFGHLFGKNYADRMEFRTINGVSSKIIGYYSKNFGRKPAFSLLENDKDRAQILGQIYQQCTDEFPTINVIKDIQTGITYIKNMMLSDEEIEKMSTGVKNLPFIYHQYNEIMIKRSQMDYDDQMAYAYKILCGYQNVLTYFQDKFLYICVDESQDTSKIQHTIIHMLAQKSGNIFMVGDEDQSIYGFRAAYPDALMDFEEQYLNAKVLLMEENYRSTPEILQPANAFISRNRFRHKKTIRPTRSSGLPVRIIYTIDRLAQFKYLFAEAQTCKPKTAVLYRNNDSALPLIDMFERKGITYNVHKFEETFFSNRLVTDVVDIITLALQPTDEDIFMRTYYKFGSPISKKSAALACERSRRSGKPIFEELLQVPEIKGYVRDAVIDLATMLPGLPNDSAETALHRVWHGMRYRSYAEENKLDAGKFDILILLAKNEGSAEALLRRLRDIKTILQNHQNTSKAKLLLSSIHSSKGLEYDRVFLLDVIDGTLPSITESSAKTDAEIREYEEERRLFYVAMTRAKNELFLFKSENNPSSFLDEFLGSLPKELIDNNDVFSSLRQSLCGKTYTDCVNGKGMIIAHCDGRVLIEYGKQAVQAVTIEEMLINRDKTIQYIPPPPPKSSGSVEAREATNAIINMYSIAPGNRVVHKRFGDGTVLGYDGICIYVRFDTEKEPKKFDLKMSLEKGFMRIVT